MGHILAVPPSMEPWPSELPSSYDAASQLKDKKSLENDNLSCKIAGNKEKVIKYGQRRKGLVFKCAFSFHSFS